ncbi:XRE family transcriptional regulator [Salmonella enterica]|nr:XRE family transcriptional regulator [Salmonella enterica]
MIAKTDSDIRHVTPSGGNVFADLGVDKQDAEKLYADSLREIENTLAIKEQLMEEITLWITQNQMKQVEVATVLHISRPRVSDVVNKKCSKFTIDALVNMLSRIGKPVRVTVGP